MSEPTRVVLISGATKGLGRELSFAFGAAGYHVVGLYHSDSAAAAELSSEFEDRALSGVFIRQDVAVNGPWPEVESAIESSRSRRFTLVANASPPFTPKPLHLIETPELSDLLNVNVIGNFNLLKRLLPVMARERSGLVISVLSSAVSGTPKGFAAYAAAKAGLRTLTESAAAEYSSRGVRFLCVSPGFMETSLTQSWSPHLRSAMSRTLHPSNVASRILELAEDPTLPGQGETYEIDEIAADRMKS